MNGFEIFLCVIAGIILLIVGILSIPVHVSFTYTDKIYLTVRYLFLKFDILPLGPKKEKKKKETKPTEEKPAEEKPKEEASKEKKPNPILEMVKANGYDGMMEIIQKLGQVLGKYGKKLLKSIIFDEIELYISVGSGDASQTAINYGKTCQKVYPVFGFICNNNKVKKYDINVEPDFLANYSEGEMYMSFHLVVRKILNATIAMAVRLVFKVALTFFKGAKKNKSSAQTSNETAEETSVN